MTYLICKDCGHKEPSGYYSIDVYIICKACERKHDEQQGGADCERSEQSEGTEQ